MSAGGYKITDQSATYFVSFAVIGWVDVFSRKEYRDIVIDSLKYCQAEKGFRPRWCPPSPAVVWSCDPTLSVVS